MYTGKSATVSYFSNTESNILLPKFTRVTSQWKTRVRSRRRSTGGDSSAVSARSGVTTSDTSWAAGNALAHRRDASASQKPRLMLTSFCRATTNTDASGASDAATISRLSASDHDPCRRLPLKLAGVEGPTASIVPILGTLAEHAGRDVPSPVDITCNKRRHFSNGKGSVENLDVRLIGFVEPKAPA